jgi:hypothetical protein
VKNPNPKANPATKEETEQIRAYIIAINIQDIQ